MPENSLKSAQAEGTYRGKLQINVTSSLGLIPIPDATVTISYTGEAGTPIEKLRTCRLYTIPRPRERQKTHMASSALYKKKTL